jgi:ADP-ribosylglycohydrolase
MHRIYGSGGSARIAPIGVAYRNASDDVLHKAVVDAVLCTHTHPQSVDGAFVQAKAVATLVKTDPAHFNVHSFLESLHSAARTDGIRNTIQKALKQVFILFIIFTYVFLHCQLIFNLSTGKEI